MNTDVDKGILCRYTYWIQMNLNIVICGKAGPQRGQPNCTTWLLHGQNWSDPASKPWTKNRSYSLWHQSFHYFHKTQFISIFNISSLILMNIHIQILLMMYNTLLFILINVMTLNQVIITNYFIHSITPAIHLTNQCIGSADTELMLLALFGPADGRGCQRKIYGHSDTIKGTGHWTSEPLRIKLLLKYNMSKLQI